MLRLSELISVSFNVTVIRPNRTSRSIGFETQGTRDNSNNPHGTCYENKVLLLAQDLQLID